VFGRASRVRALNLRKKAFTFDQSFSMGFTEKHFASSFTLMPLSYPSKINYRASLCSIALTFFDSVVAFISMYGWDTFKEIIIKFKYPL
jgi:hypothetical protein